MGRRSDRTRGAVLGIATGLVLAGLAACGTAAAGGKPAVSAGHGDKPVAKPVTTAAHAHIPKACSGLTIVRTASSDPVPPGGFLAEPEQFGAYVPGKPFLVLTLDDHGLRFSPDTVRFGTYDVCFVDRRAADAGHDVSFRFFVTGPRLPMSSIAAGTIGNVLFCPGAEGWLLFVDDQPASGKASPRYGNLGVEPGTGCETVVT